jgi:hypothetical protein
VVRRRRELTRRVGNVSLAHHAAVLLRQEEDDGGRGQGAELERDEYEVAAMDSKRAHEQAAHEPHGPGAAADPRRAVFFAEMDHLGHVGQHRDRDSGDTEDLEHGFSYSSMRRCLLRLQQRWPPSTVAAFVGTLPRWAASREAATLGMEHLWSPAVATSRNGWQICGARERQ